MDNIFLDIGFIIIIATLFAYLANLLRQPLILGYVLTGIIIGPVLGLITNTNVIETLSEIGIAFLLFIVGLQIDLRKLKDVSFVSSIGGLINITVLFSFGFIFASMVGFASVESLYLGLIIAFSSTMVVIKLLSDKRELDTLHGRIIIGFLLVEDIVAIIAVSVITTLNHFSLLALLLSLLKGLAIFAVAILASKYVFPTFFKFAAKSQELLFLLAVMICFLFSLLFNQIGFSIAIGAFVAGISLANLPYNIEIIGKAKSLRDFFSTIFFVSLGMQLLIGSISRILIPLIVLVLFILFAKPLIIMFVSSFFGYEKRTSFLAGSSLAQTSEFSLIIISQGLILGQVSQEIFTLAVILALTTMTATAYFIKFEDKIYRKSAPYLKIFDLFARSSSYNLEYIPKKMSNFVLICGHNRIGYSIVKTLTKMKKKFLIVDFNPETIRDLIKNKTPCLYGDVGNVEILERLNLKYVSMVISTVPTQQDNLLLIKKLREVNKKAPIFVTANQVEEALHLYQSGADYVILPHFLGGEHVSVLIQKSSDNIQKMLKTKKEHIEELYRRKNLGHEHPSHNEK